MIRETLRRLLPGVWLGLLLGVALLATPAPFAVLDRPTAGRVVAWIFSREAATSVVLAVVILVIERRRALEAWQEGRATSQFSGPMIAALAAFACTMLGYYALQPMMAQARLAASGLVTAAEAPALSFGQLHAVSLGLFAVKILAVAVLAIGVARPSRPAKAASTARPDLSPPASS